MSLPRPINTALSSPNTQGITSVIEYTLSNFFPGYAHISQRFPKLFTLASLILAIYYIVPFEFLRRQWSRLSSLLVSAVSVETGDDLFEPMAEWLAQKTWTVRANNRLTAKTNVPKAPRRGEPGYTSDPEQIKDRKNSGRALPQVQYEHAEGIQIFFHKRSIFWSVRGKGTGEIYNNGSYKKTEIITFHTLGRSTAPVEHLFKEVWAAKWHAEHTETIVRRPVRAQYGSGMQWNRIASKAHRSLDTIFLHDDQSTEIVNDVEDYLSEDTRDFYQERGIPYRRGYLLHGAPGCGKTSFTLALAAKFNLDVYIMTLLDSFLDDTTLTSLLNSLPTPCIFLLEDIDQAGLGRKTKRGKRRHRGNQQGGAFDVARDFVSSDESEVENRRGTSVTLSGLLNAIDGVAAPEGHILIMTTNAPEDLDDALVRAGRISVKAEFTLASRDQARQMFVGMFPPEYIVRKWHASAGFLNGFFSPATALSPEKTALNIASLAERFVENMKDNDLSPAELQDYLVSHKENPIEAVDGIEAFIGLKRAERAEREAKKEQAKEDKVKRAALRKKAYEKQNKKSSGKSDGSANESDDNDDSDDKSDNENDDGDEDNETKAKKSKSKKSRSKAKSKSRKDKSLTDGTNPEPENNDASDENSADESESASASKSKTRTDSRCELTSQDKKTKTKDTTSKWDDAEKVIMNGAEMKVNGATNAEKADVKNAQTNGHEKANDAKGEAINGIV